VTPCIKDGCLRVALVNGVAWLISKDEIFLHSPWGEGKLGPKGKANLSDPLPVFPYEIVEGYSALAWNSTVAAYGLLGSLEPDGPRSAGRLKAQVEKYAKEYDAAVITELRKLLASGFRKDLLGSV